MLLPNWVGPFIGIPFKEKGRTLDGCDCWGLVRLALERGFGVLVPDYSEDYATTTDREEIDALIHQVSTGWEEHRVSEAQPGDVVLFRIQGQVCHVGLVGAPPRFLHCQRGIGSCLERWDSLIWERRVWSVMRHPAMQLVNR